VRLPANGTLIHGGLAAAAMLPSVIVHAVSLANGSGRSVASSLH